MASKKMDVSIVICTHRRFDVLAGAVESLVHQTASPDTYEVIVVDNDHHPNPSVQEVVSNVSSQISLRYLHESKLGLSRARNSGGKLAKSDYVGYLDDDARANPKHIEILTRICKTYKPDICGGPFYPFYVSAKPEWFNDRYGTGFCYGHKPRYLNSDEYLGGGNIVFRRNLLDTVEWFDPHLGMIGDKIWYGEDTKLMVKAWRMNPGLKVYYEPRLFVLHLVPDWKMSIRKLIKIEYLKGKSHAYFWISEDKHNIFRRLAPYILMLSLLCLGFKMFRGALSFSREKYPFWQNFAIEMLNPDIERIGRYVQLTSNLFSKSRNDSSILLT
jgi:glycosyltransferase involved in cell wall biosynthesis